MGKKRVLTGIQATGAPHIGNYLGAIKPAIEMSRDENYDSFLFIANYHSLSTIHDGKTLEDLTYGVAATWLALGLDPERTTFYRQSDVPEILELNWILSSFTSKGLMNRAHAYKGLLDQNVAKGVDPDKGINMGVYTYPILMTADILIFKTDEVPVGQDQRQHIEMARDIANVFNSTYKKDILKLPNGKISEELAVIPGLDGRKMSKSYNNTIPLFVPEKKLRKLIMKIVTDSTPPEAPKDPKSSFLFDLYKLFGTEEEVKALEKCYLEGIAWGHAKEELFLLMNRHLTPYREKYDAIISDKEGIEKVLKKGADKARAEASANLAEIKKCIGC